MSEPREAKIPDGLRSRLIATDDGFIGSRERARSTPQ
jgi:hypothetical protein